MLFYLSHCLSVGRLILPTVVLCPPLFLSVHMSDDVYCSSVVASVVDERGIKFFGSGIFGSVTKKHVGVLVGIFDRIFKVEFGDLLSNYLVEVCSSIPLS